MSDVPEDLLHARQEAREQQPAGVDDGTPRLTDAPRRGEAALRKTAEDVREHVAGLRRAHHLPDRIGARLPSRLGNGHGCDSSQGGLPADDPP